jgi:uncharacterized protein YlxP (DUF503 family)
MNVGILQIELTLSDGNSLKEKRQVLKGLKDRIKNNFNASIAEIGHLDKWRRSVIGIAVISNGKRDLSSYLDNIVSFIGRDRRITLLDHTVEIL